MIWYEFDRKEKGIEDPKKHNISSGCFGGNETGVFARLPTRQSPLFSLFFFFFFSFVLLTFPLFRHSMFWACSWVLGVKELLYKFTHIPLS